MSLLDVDYLRECFREENGRLYWKERPVGHFPSVGDWKRWHTRFAGKEAGHLSVRKLGGNRWLVRLSGISMLRYTIIWAMYKDAWPDELDHENRNSLDDQIGNLRLADQSQNMANSRKRKNNASGYKGVRWHKRARRWCAQITVNYQQIHLGYFDTPEEAYAVYCDAAVQYFGQFACG